MKTPFFSILFSALCTVLSAQPRTDAFRKTVDSLTETALTLHEAGENYDSALAVANRALALARSATPPYRKGMGDGYVAIGRCQTDLGYFNEARESYFKARDIRRDLKDRSGEASVYNNLAVLMERQMEYESSIRWAQQAIAIWSDPVDSSRLAKACNNIANCFDELNQTDSAIIYNRKSIALTQRPGDRLELAKSEYGLANRLFKKQAGAEAEQHARIALRLFETLRARDELADVYNLLGVIHLNNNRIDSAETWLLRALEAYAEKKDTLGRVDAWLNLGLVYKEKNNDERAGMAYDSAWVNIEQMGDRLHSNDLLDLLQERIEALEMRKAAKRENWYKTVALAGCVLLGFVGLLFWQRNKNQGLELKNRQLLLQNRDLQLAELKIKNDKMVDALTNQYLIEQKQLRLDAMKMERERIGRDLHDVVSNRLNTLRKNLELVELQHAAKYPELKAPLENAIGETDIIYKKAYAIYTDLSHHDSDWLLSLKGYCTQIGPVSGVDIRFITEGKLHAIPAGVGNELERIVMELVSNACKHAEAKNLSVEIVLDNKRLHILVEDDGKGFNPDDLTRRSGLNILPKRVENLGGALSIDSAPGRGTTISVQIPLQPETQA